MRVPQRSKATAPRILMSISVIDVVMTHLLNSRPEFSITSQFRETVRVIERIFSAK